MSSYACPEGRPLSGRLRDAPFDYSNDHCSGAFVEPGGAHIQRRSCVMADRTLLTVHPLQRIYIYASTQVIKHRTASAWLCGVAHFHIFIIIFVISLISNFRVASLESRLSFACSASAFRTRCVHSTSSIVIDPTRQHRSRFSKFLSRPSGWTRSR